MNDQLEKALEEFQAKLVELDRANLFGSAELKQHENDKLVEYGLILRFSKLQVPDEPQTVSQDLLE